MGFCGVNCQPDLLQRFWGKVYSRLLHCRLVECQETKALARTSAADWSSIRSCGCNFWTICWGLYLLWGSSEFWVTPYFPLPSLLRGLAAPHLRLLQYCFPKMFAVSLLTTFFAPWCSLSGCVWTFKNDTLYTLKIVGHWCRHNGSPNISDVNITIPTSKESENTQ